MILQRLYELAKREKLLADPAFTRKAIACRIDIDGQGNLLGLHDLREEKVLPPKSTRGKSRKVLTNGKEYFTPVRPVVWDDKQSVWKTTDPAASGKEKPALLLADTIARVLPVERLIDDNSRDKFQAQRSTFWRFLRHAVSQIGDESLLPLVLFADRLDSPDLQEQLCQQVESLGLRLSDTCTPALHVDAGQTVLEADAMRSWWRSFYQRDFAAQQEGEFRGLCQVTGQIAAIASSVKSRISGLIPIGCRADAYLVTGLASAESYKLPGAQTGMVSSEGIDGLTRGLNALIRNELDEGTTSHRIGSVMFLFWTRQKTDTGIIVSLFEPQPQQVDNLLSSLTAGRCDEGISSDDAFYLLTLSGNSARVIVRDYLETPLPRLREQLARWFADLRIADTTKDGQGQPTSLFPLWQLALATAKDGDQVAPDTPSRLMASAITGSPLPESLLVACLGRLRAEGNGGFRKARMALIKLVLLRRGVPVTETLNSDDRHPAYLYGRLLAVFEQIQYAALGEVNANVVDKFYGIFSAAPALVFSRLFANARHHLRRLRGEKPGSFVALDKLLTEVSSLLPPLPPKAQLSLQDQGRFALGYYHQRAKRFEGIAERKATKAAPSVGK